MSRSSKFAACLAVFLGSFSLAEAQISYVPAADTRPPVPQDIANGRTDWGLDLGFGGSFVQSSASDDSLNGNFDVFKTLKPSKSTVYLDGDFINNTVNGASIVNQGALTALYNNQLFLPAPFKFFIFDTNAYNNLFQLNYRATNGVGVCYDDLRWGKSHQVLSLALSSEYENFTSGMTDTTGRAVFHDEFKMDISKTAKVHADFFYMPSLAGVGNYRLSGEISLETLIWARYLGLKVSWTDEYDSYLHQYAPTVSLNDSVWTTALTYHFGR